MLIKRFEEYKCWQKARELVNLVFDICEKPLLLKHFSIKDQLIRASLSVMNNIAEGHGRLGKLDFAKFLGYSVASAMEVKSMTYVLLDRKFINQQEFEKLYKCADDSERMIKGLIKYIKSNIKK